MNNLIESLITEFEKLPGIGHKSASRLAYFFLNAPDDRFSNFLSVLTTSKKTVVKCVECFNFTEKGDNGDNLCEICSNKLRNLNQICVVEEALDVLAIESAGIYKGIYHVLGGVLSPMKGIAPENIRLYELKSRITKGNVNEVIIALNQNLEGEATAMYIKNVLRDFVKVKVSRIARGLPTGGDIEYADFQTLEKSFENRSEIL